MVLDDAPDEVAAGEVPGDRAPRAPAVGALQEVGPEVAGLVVVEGDVDGARVVEVGLDVVHEGARRNAGQRPHLDPPPALPAVLRHLEEPVVGAGVEEPLRLRRLGERRDRVEGGHGRHVPRRVPAPLPAHEGEGHAVLVPREVARDRAPAVAPVVGAPHALRGVVEPLRRVRAHEDGRVPVEALDGVARLGLGLDVDALARRAVHAHEVPLLPLGVQDVGVAGLGGRLVAVGEEGDEPVGVPDSVGGCRCARGRPGCCCPGSPRRRCRRARRRPPRPCRTASPAGSPRSARSSRGRSSRRSRRRCRRGGSRGRPCGTRSRGCRSACPSPPSAGRSSPRRPRPACARPRGRCGPPRAGSRRAPGSSGARSPRRRSPSASPTRSRGRSSGRRPPCAGSARWRRRGRRGSAARRARPILPSGPSGRPFFSFSQVAPPSVERWRPDSGPPPM